MRVLQINAVYGMGSTGHIVQDIEQSLVSNGHESFVMWATGCKNDAGVSKLIRIGSTLDHKLHALLYRLVGGQGMHSIGATRRACRKILEIKPDVVHLHNLHSNYVHIPTLFKFLAKHEIPTLLTLHDCWFMTGHCTHYKTHDCDRWQMACENCPAVNPRFQKGVQAFHAQRKELYADMEHLYVNGVSQWTADAAKRSILCSARDIVCIYNWIDTEKFKPQGSAEMIRKKYGIRENRKLVLGVSQLWNKVKGLDALVALADALCDSADIILVGQDGGVPQKENLRCIGFVESQQALIDLYSAADVLVNASNAETFGLVTAEALACGTPVAAYHNSGAAEIVADGCGILADDGDVAQLIAGTKTILETGKGAYSEVCRARVLKTFEKEKQLQTYIAFYQHMISSKE